MLTAARTVWVALAVSVAVFVSVAALVVAASRPATILAAPAALGAASTSSGSTTATAGVLTSGDAIVSLKPDLATISTGISSQQSTAAAAQSDLASKAAKLIARVKALGVSDADLTTTGYWVGPTYGGSDYQTITGYQASETLQVKWHDVNTVGKTLDAIVQEGGAGSISVGFGLADPKSAQATARTLAIGEARAKAEAMASAAGVKLGSPVRISDLSTAVQYPYPMDAAGRAAAPSATTQVPVGQVDVQVTVEVDFALA